MTTKTYTRKDPSHYAAQRTALKGCVLAGVPVRAAARRFDIPYSTARLWVAQDGLRRVDQAADAAGEARPAVGSWAKPGRGRERQKAGQTGLPRADYPELKGVSGRKRLTALGTLASTARMRAVAAIEEGCITYAMASLREAQRLDRAWRTLRDWLEMYPEAEEEVDDWRARALAELEALEDCETMMAREAERGGPAPKSPQQLADAPLYAAVEAAFAAQPGWTEAERSDAELDIFLEVHRLKEARTRWHSLPGRGEMPIVVNLPARRNRAPPGVVAGAPAYAGEAFPIVFRGEVLRREGK